MSDEIKIEVTATDAASPTLAKVAAAGKKMGDEVAAGGKKAGDGLDEGTRKASKFGDSMRRVGEVAAGVLAADLAKVAASKAIDFFKSSAEAASSLGESMNAVSKVFGTGSAKINEFGQDSAKAVGLSTRAFNEMATTLGAGLRNAGLTVDQTADKTIALTKRASDMASVFNTDVSEALQAIQAGLRGEADPLERFGVGLSAAAVQSRALADSGKASAAELSNQEMALARINIIMDQTASSAGDFAQTSNGLANAQRIATAQIENAQAKIGQGLLPVLGKAAQAAGDFAEAFSKLPNPLQMTVLGIAAVAAGALAIVPRVQAVRASLDEMRASSSKGSAALADVASGASKAAAAFGIAFAAASILGGFLEEDLNPNLQATGNGLVEWSRSGRLAGEAARVFGDGMKDLSNELDNPGLSGSVLKGSTDTIKAFDATLTDLVSNGHADQAAAILARLNEEWSKTMGAELAAQRLEKLKDNLPDYAAALENAAHANDGATESVGKTAGALKDQADSLDDVRTKWDEMNEIWFGVEEAQDAATEAMQSLTDKIAEQKKANDKNAGSFRGNSEAALENRAALREVIEKYQGLVEKQAEHGVSSKKTIAEFEKQLEKLGVAKGKAHDYAAALADMVAEMAKVKSKTVTVTVNTRYTDTGAPGTHHEYAHGGITGAASGGARGGVVRVNEEGPELASLPSGDLVSLPTGTTVHPAGESRAMLAGGGSGVVYLAPLVVQGDPGVEAIMDRIAYIVDTQYGGDVMVALRRRR
jgi:hypothetical protein